VAIYDNKIVGNIVYVESKTINNGTEHTILTFGPLSVLPEYQNKGIGGKLINHTIKLSKEMGYKAIIIYGDPEYYKRFGFKESKVYCLSRTCPIWGELIRWVGVLRFDVASNSAC
jgi:predicted N-acetyltransferase YhbS